MIRFISDKWSFSCYFLIIQDTPHNRIYGCQNTGYALAILMAGIFVIVLQYVLGFIQGAYVQNFHKKIYQYFHLILPPGRWLKLSLSPRVCSYNPQEIFKSQRKLWLWLTTHINIKNFTFKRPTVNISKFNYVGDSCFGTS